MIPRVRYTDLNAGLSPEMVEKIKKAGTVIVTGAVPVDVRIEQLGFPLIQLLIRFPRKPSHGSNLSETMHRSIVTDSKVRNSNLGTPISPPPLSHYIQVTLQTISKSMSSTTPSPKSKPARILPSSTLKSSSYPSGTARTPSLRSASQHPCPTLTASVSAFQATPSLRSDPTLTAGRSSNGRTQGFVRVGRGSCKGKEGKHGAITTLSTHLPGSGRNTTSTRARQFPVSGKKY